MLKKIIIIVLLVLSATLLLNTATYSGRKLSSPTSTSGSL